MLNLKRVSRILGVALFTASLLGIPSNALASADFGKSAKLLNVTINITDSGFDQPEVTLGASSGALYGQVTFVNTGSTVHSATAVPGGAGFMPFVNLTPNGTGGKSQINRLDTGGLAPGQSASLAFSYNGDYSYTSSPDCLAGDRPAITPFNCTPAVIHVVSYTGPISNPMLSSTLDGNTLEVPGVRTPHFDTKSSAAKPASGIVNVSITDDRGYLPSRIWITPGTTVVWTNNGQNVHSVVPRGGFSSTPDNFKVLNSGGLAPGQSYSYTFNYNAPVRCNGVAPDRTDCTGYTVMNVFGTQSNQEPDLILPRNSGFAVAARATSSTMIMKIFQVVKCGNANGVGFC